MQRVTITLDDELHGDSTAIIAARGYQNRSEAIPRPGARGIQQAAHETGANGDCVAALVYVYDHAARELSKAPWCAISTAITTCRLRPARPSRQ